MWRATHETYVVGDRIRIVYRFTCTSCGAEVNRAADRAKHRCWE